MKIGITPLKRILSILLILAMMCSVFVSCASGEGNESDSNNDESYASSDLNGDGEINGDDIESEDGIIPIFANGDYVAKIIRPETASQFEKDVYNKLVNVFHPAIANFIPLHTRLQ